MAPILYMLCGLPGSGKTTRAKELEAAGDGILVNADDWVCLLYPDDAEAAARDERKGHVEQVQWELVERLLSAGVSVILDWGVWMRAERDHYREPSSNEDEACQDAAMGRTIWVFGDQLNMSVGALADADPGVDRVLLIESEASLRGGFHRQRLHAVVAAMRRFAAELSSAGFEVDHRRASSLASGFAAHVVEHSPTEVIATEPNGREIRAALGRLGVRTVRSNQFLCHPDEFAAWAGDRTRLRMEDFYRWQRVRLGYLMEGDGPAGGRWNFDAENRLPPPKGGGDWPEPLRTDLDALDRRVLEGLPGDATGADPVGWWATSRAGALERLEYFLAEVLPGFGPHEDAMTEHSWHLAHSLLSPYLNLGLLLPGEVCDRVEAAYREGRAPIASAEGIIRQIIGWREFVWGVYWLWPDQETANELGHHHPLPPAFNGEAGTAMRCVAIALDGVEERAWVHHIQRLMVLANIANLMGIDPTAVRSWMRRSFVDGANWVMGPNVMGMGLWADGGRMSSKPYVSGGGYINRMSDYCRSCRFDPGSRIGADACPFTTLYWDFLDRHRDRLRGNHRMARQYGTLDRLAGIAEVRQRAAEVIDAFRRGVL